jgi:hypothetical protein
MVGRDVDWRFHNANQTRLPTMSTITLVDLELRDALAHRPQVR